MDDDQMTIYNVVVLNCTPYQASESKHNSFIDWDKLGGDNMRCGLLQASVCAYNVFLCNIYFTNRAWLYSLT